MSDDISQRLNLINQKIRKAEKRAGREENSVRLMAVSKFHPVEAIFDATKSGQILFGENRVQEALEKFPAIFEQYPATQLHIIGTLQSNKVKNAVKIASCIQSVDRLDLLSLIEKQAGAQDKTIQVLLEYHTAEDSKSGFQNDDEICMALDRLSAKEFPHVDLQGFMTMAPFTSNEKAVRESFIKTRKLAEKMRAEYPDFALPVLSMGMSGDFEIAIEEGSTLVRVGTAIFGERAYSKK